MAPLIFGFSAMVLLAHRKNKHFDGEKVFAKNVAVTLIGISRSMQATGAWRFRKQGIISRKAAEHFEEPLPSSPVNPASSPSG